MITGLGAISESYFLQHPGSAEAKSAEYCFFFPGFSVAGPCLFLLFPGSIRCVCIWFSSDSLKGSSSWHHLYSQSQEPQHAEKKERHCAFPEVTTYLLIEDFEARGFH